MSDRDSQTTILVDLDVAKDSERAVRAAATLAAALSAEMHGLFVVDDAWHDLARLPFVVAIDPDHGTTAEVSPDTMKSAINRREHSSRNDLISHAERMQVGWKFSRESGQIVELLHTTAQPGDYIVLSGPARIEGAAGLLRQLAAIPKSTSGVVVCSERGKIVADSPVIVLLGTTAANEPAAALGAKVSAILNAPLLLFIIASKSTVVDGITEKLNGQLASTDFSSYRFLPGSPDVLSQTLQRAAPRFVIVSGEISAATRDEDIVRLIKAAKAPVCLLKD